MDGGTCWASLPPDLVIRIADRFLVSNDIDYYIDLRAVCRDWRHATDDPTNTWDVRFRPCRWIVFCMDDKTDTTHLFVNTATGRFHRKDMPLLSGYDHVVATKGGFLVLEDKADPAVVFVLNPFTGFLTRFMAPTTHFSITNVAAIVSGSPPTLTLCSRHHGLHRAGLDGEHVSICHENWHHNRLFWHAIGGGVYDLTGGSPSSDDLLEMLSSDLIELFAQKCGFLVESNGEALMVVKHDDRGMEVFKLGAGASSEPVKSIGDDRAIFIGIYRCVSVDASKFPSINGNSIYYVKASEKYPCNEMIYRYDIKKAKEKMVCRDVDVFDGTTCDRGIKITRLLSRYTTTPPDLTTCTLEELSL